MKVNWNQFNVYWNQWKVNWNQLKVNWNQLKVDWNQLTPLLKIMIQYNSDPGPSEKFTLNRHQNLFGGVPLHYLIKIQHYTIVVVLISSFFLGSSNPVIFSWAIWAVTMWAAVWAAISRALTYWLINPLIYYRVTVVYYL